MSDVQRPTSIAGCWAAGVTPCEGPLTDEHYASYGLFLESTVLVVGGPLAKNGPVRIPIKRLVTKCLCRGHNNALSDLDQAGIDFQNVLRRVWEINEVRCQVPADFQWSDRRFVLDGLRLERWLLKFAFSAAPVFRHDIGDWRPSREQAALALGTRPVESTLGLYTAMGLGHQATNEERMTFSFGSRLTGGAPSAFAVALRGGYRFVCAWDSAQAPGETIVFEGERRAPSTLMRHPNRLEVNPNGINSGLSIDFDWSGHWRAADHPLVTNLRSRYKAPPR